MGRVFDLGRVQYNKFVMTIKSEIPKSFKPISSCLSEGVKRPRVRTTFDYLVKSCDYKNPPITYKSSI